MIDNLYDSEKTIFVNASIKNSLDDQYSDNELKLGVKIGDYLVIKNDEFSKNQEVKDIPRYFPREKIDNMRDQFLRTYGTFSAEKIINIRDQFSPIHGDLSPNEIEDILEQLSRIHGSLSTKDIENIRKQIYDILEDLPKKKLENEIIIKTKPVFRIANLIPGDRYKFTSGPFYDNLISLVLLASNLQLLYPDEDDIMMVKQYIYNQYYSNEEIRKLKDFSRIVNDETNGQFNLSLHTFAPPEFKSPETPTFDEIGNDREIGFDEFYQNRSSFPYILYYLASFTNLNLIYKDNSKTPTMIHRVLVNDKSYDVHINYGRTRTLALNILQPSENRIGTTLIHKHDARIFSENSLKVEKLIELRDTEKIENTDQAQPFFDVSELVHTDTQLGKGFFLCVVFENEFDNAPIPDVGIVHYFTLNTNSQQDKKDKLVYFKDKANGKIENNSNKEAKKIQFSVLYKNYIQSTKAIDLNHQEFILMKNLPYPFNHGGNHAYSGIKVEPYTLKIEEKNYNLVYYGTQNIIQILSFYDQSHLYNGMNPLYLKDIPLFSNGTFREDFTMRKLLENFPSFENNILKDGEFDNDFKNSLMDYFDVDLEIINMNILFHKLSHNMVPINIKSRIEKEILNKIKKTKQNPKTRNIIGKSQRDINNAISEFVKKEYTDLKEWTEPSTLIKVLRNKITLLMITNIPESPNPWASILNIIDPSGKPAQLMPGYYLICEPVKDIFLKSI